jgi:hypothetical protein
MKMMKVGDEGEKVDPARFPREEISLHFDARQPLRLYPPQAPRLLHEIFAKAGECLWHQEALPSEPIRYW